MNQTDTSKGSHETVSDLGEHQLIKWLHSRIPSPPPWVKVEIGDDAAVVEPERNSSTVLTVDALIEGIHFDFSFIKPIDVGFKSLVASLSDLAAMGATPRVALLSLALPPHLPLRVFKDVVDGLLEAAKQYSIQLVGGNMSRSPEPLVIDVTALGAVGKRRILTRRGAKPGDELFVSGTIGSAATGLKILKAESSVLPNYSSCPSAIERFCRPAPRVRLGKLVGKNRAASACIDLSDGLADAVHQLASTNDVGMRINGNAIPIDPDIVRWCQKHDSNPLKVALQGGEDYELLFVVPKKSRRNFLALKRLIRGLPLTSIGVVTSETAVLLEHNGRTSLLPSGFMHF